MNNNIYCLKKVVSHYDISRKVPESVVNDYVTKILSLTNPKLVCDAGCGTGYVLNAFSKFHTNVFGVDQSEEMIKLAGDNAYLTNIEDLLTITKTKPDLIHIKAVTHIPKEPELLLDSLFFSVAENGYLVIGAENSYPEDLLENIRLYKGEKEDSLADFYSYYFWLREQEGIPFVTPRMPAGNYTNASIYLKSKGATLIKEIQSNSWQKELSFNELLNAMSIGSFSVFKRGVNNTLRIKIVNELRKYILKKNYDLNKVHSYTANLQAVILQKRGIK